MAKQKRESRECIWCGRGVAPVGNMRKNGKAGRNDWSGRCMHIKCFKEARRCFYWDHRREPRSNTELVSYAREKSALENKA